jgi:hypothetical protein
MVHVMDESSDYHGNLVPDRELANGFYTAVENQKSYELHYVQRVDTIVIRMAIIS